MLIYSIAISSYYISSINDFLIEFDVSPDILSTFTILFFNEEDVIEDKSYSPKLIFLDYSDI